MARARNIKPGFFKNEDLAEIAPVGRLLFIGLWTIADRNGVLEDRPKKIKLVLLPCDIFDPEEVLRQLAERQLITRFTVGGLYFIHITNFAKHQNPHHTEKESGLPRFNNGETPEIHGEVTVDPPCSNGEYPAGFTDSLIHRFIDSDDMPADAGIEENPPEQKVLNITEKRGSRFELQEMPIEWIRWSSEKYHWTTERSQSVYERFTDYWISAAGAKARKTDWFATWRNWCRNENDRAGPKQSGMNFIPPQQRESHTDRAIRIAHERVLSGDQL